jgi:hypothetical protein
VPNLIIQLNAEGLLEGVDPDSVVHVTTPLTVAPLAGGMASGSPSVMITCVLPDGRTLVAETSLKLFLQAAKIFNDRFADGRHRQRAAEGGHDEG